MFRHRRLSLLFQSLHMQAEMNGARLLKRRGRPALK